MQRRGKTVRFFIAASALAILSLVFGPLSLAQTKDQGPKLHASSSLVSTQQFSVMADAEMESSSKSQTDVFVLLPGAGTQADHFSWSSHLWVQNLDSSPANVQFFLFKLNQSNPTPAVYNDTLATGEMRRYDRAAETLFGEAGASVLRVISHRKLVVRSSIKPASLRPEERDIQKAQSKNLTAKETQLSAFNELWTADHEQRREIEELARQFFAAIPASFAIGAGQQTNLLGAFQPNILTHILQSFPVGLVETSGDTATVKVTALDETRNALASKDYTLAGFELRLYNLSDSLSGLSTSKTNIVVEVVSGPGKIITFGSELAREMAITGEFNAGQRQASVANEANSDKLTEKAEASKHPPSEASPQQGSVTGSGIVGRVPLWTGNNVLGNSVLAASPEGEVGRVSIDGAFDENTKLVVYGFGLTAVSGQATAGIGVEGQSESNYGVRGISNRLEGVIGISDTKAGVYGGGKTEGVVGQSSEGIGVSGVSTTREGVFGVSTSGTAVRGEGSYGVVGISTGGGYGVLGGCAEGVPRCGAALFNGSLQVTGVKLFHIDHPLDPANKYLNHASVESPEMKNVYDGMTVLDSQGEAVVTLPGWFETLNKNFRYQLTAVGAPGPNLYVAEEIKNNRFKIAGGTPGMKVSWQVTGIRQDAWAKAHPVVVEEDKSDAERGHYLNPELFGQPADSSLLKLLRQPSKPMQPQGKDRDAIIKELKEELLK
ncbi:MAG: hypothetical protein HY314_10780 [Acidobacteria bacterium]|nr:hypothetical protein [Acidobacteriota bacterium]